MSDSLEHKVKLYENKGPGNYLAHAPIQQVQAIIRSAYFGKITEVPRFGLHLEIQLTDNDIWPNFVYYSSLDDMKELMQDLGCDVSERLKGKAVTAHIVESGSKYTSDGFVTTYHVHALSAPNK